MSAPTGAALMRFTSCPVIGYVAASPPAAGELKYARYEMAAAPAGCTPGRPREVIRTSRLRILPDRRIAVLLLNCLALPADGIGRMTSGWLRIVQRGDLQRK